MIMISKVIRSVVKSELSNLYCEDSTFVSVSVVEFEENHREISRTGSFLRSILKFN